MPQNYLCSIVKCCNFTRTNISQIAGQSQPYTQSYPAYKIVRNEFFVRTKNDTVAELCVAMKTHLNADRALSLNVQYLWIDVYAVEIGDTITDATPHIVYRIEEDFNINTPFDQVQIQVKTRFYSASAANNEIFLVDDTIYPVKTSKGFVCEQVQENINPYLFARMRQDTRRGKPRHKLYPNALRRKDVYEGPEGHYRANGEGPFGKVKFANYRKWIKASVLYEANLTFDKDGKVAARTPPVRPPLFQKPQFNLAQAKRERMEFQAGLQNTEGYKDMLAMIQEWYYVELEKAQWNGQITRATQMPIYRLRGFVNSLLKLVGLEVFPGAAHPVHWGPKALAYQLLHVDTRSSSIYPEVLYGRLYSYGVWFLKTGLFLHGDPGEFEFQDFSAFKTVQVAPPNPHVGYDPDAYATSVQWFASTSQYLRQLAYYYNVWYANAIRMVHTITHYMRLAALEEPYGSDRYAKKRPQQAPDVESELRTWKDFPLPVEFWTGAPPAMLETPDSNIIISAVAATNFYRPPLTAPGGAAGDAESKDIFLSPLSFDARQLNIADFDREEKPPPDTPNPTPWKPGYVQWRTGKGSGYVRPPTWDNTIWPDPSGGYIQDTADKVYNFFSGNPDDGTYAQAGADAAAYAAAGGRTGAQYAYSGGAGNLAKAGMEGAKDVGEKLAYEQAARGGVVAAEEAAPPVWANGVPVEEVFTSNGVYWRASAEEMKVLMAANEDKFDWT